MVKRQRFVEEFFLDPLLYTLATLRKATITFIMSVRCMEQLDFYWTVFHEVWYLSIEYLEKIQLLFKSNKKDAYLMWKYMYMYENNSVNSSDYEKYFRQNL